MVYREFLMTPEMIEVGDYIHISSEDDGTPIWEKVTKIERMPYHPREQRIVWKCYSDYPGLLSPIALIHDKEYKIRRKYEADPFTEDNVVKLKSEPTKPTTNRYTAPVNQSKVKKTYLMINNRNGYYKIGYSSNPKYRESTLQAEDPDTSLILSFDGGKEIEKRLHDYFSHKRIRGEWFNLNLDDVKYIQSIAKLFDNKPEYELWHGSPVAIIYKKKGSKTTDSCPFCGKHHGHGSAPGHRIAHCSTGEYSEQIVAKDGTVLKQEDGYIIKYY